MQLDIFEDSRDVMLRNDVLTALEQRDAGVAHTRWYALRDEYPQDTSLQPLALLIETLKRASFDVFASHDALQAARSALESSVEPAALGLYGAAGGRAWMLPLWRSMAERAASLGFDANHTDDHAAPLWLRVGDWTRAADAVTDIESWHRIPVPLAWMAEALWRRDGIDAACPVMAELAWLAPRRLDAVLRSVDDPVMHKLLKAFHAAFDGAGDVSDLAWFPAWALTHKPRLAPFLSQARAGLHSEPERAMRLLLELLGLERQGRHHEIVVHRKQLRDLNESLYANYMKSR